MRSYNVWFGTLSETYDCWTEDSAALVSVSKPRLRAAVAGDEACDRLAVGVSPGL
jgi:hypothetical protein